MRKFKLIKTYPGFNKLGLIIEINSEQETGYYSENKEFWEEVIEKDFEILEIRGYSGYYLLQKNGTFYYSYDDVSTVLYGNKKGGNSAETILNSKHHIHSIKRLSDGEIFTIGDKITGKSKYNCTINIIELNPNCNQIMFNRLDEGIDLVNAKHYKQPLFKTEDGVDIFEGDSFAHTSGWTEPKIIRATSKHLNYKLPMDKLFSTKEKAEEYILMNNPCLSLNDIVKNTEKARSNDTFSGSVMYKRLKELVKSKTNGNK
jgi:hypothetical protein